MLAPIELEHPMRLKIEFKFIFFKMEKYFKIFKPKATKPYTLSLRNADGKKITFDSQGNFQYEEKGDTRHGTYEIVEKGGKIIKSMEGITQCWMVLFDMELQEHEKVFITKTGFTYEFHNTMSGKKLNFYWMSY
jgi:hypothetical protein